MEDALRCLRVGVPALCPAESEWATAQEKDVLIGPDHRRPARKIMFENDASSMGRIYEGCHCELSSATEEFGCDAPGCAVWMF